MKFILSKKQKFILAGIFSSLALFVAFFAEARKLEVNYPKLPGLEPLTDSTTLPDLILYIFNLSILMGGLIAFGAIIFAGFLFLTSGANPGLRLKAKTRLQQVLLGIVVLLSSYLILNTINPELVLLHTPGEELKIPESPEIGKVPPSPIGGVDIDYETLKYGGVVVFEATSLEGGGSGNRSEVVFHDIQSFQNASYIKGNDKISAIKILGGCEIEIENASADTMTISSSIGSLPEAPSKFADNVTALRFLDNSCVGNSITVYQYKNYNYNGGEEFIPGSYTIRSSGSRLFIHDNFDLRGVDFVEGNNRDVNDNIRSVRFAKDDDPEFTATFHENPGAGGNQIELTESSSVIEDAFKNKLSTVVLNSGANRQAGIVLYEHPNFKEGRQEIFIASDKKIDKDNSFLKQDHLSALKIIGKYRVTLYADNDFTGKWVQIDNGDPQNPTYTTAYNLTPNPDSVTSGQLIAEGSNILQIKDFSDTSMFCIQYKDNDPLEDCEDTFNDKLNSIKIELPEGVYETAFGSVCPSPVGGFCEL